MNIRVDLVYPISDGSPVTFKSPCDCSEVTGLIVYSPESVGNTNIVATEFIFADAHKNDVSEMNELFTEGVIVKLILDVSHNIAYVQNADTNAYLEGKFEESKKYVNEKLAESKEYVDSQINLVNASGIPKLGAYAYQEVAEEDGQTVFPIALTTFVKETDMVRVYSGITRLSPITDFVVNEDATITLTEGVPKGRTIDIEVIKHIPMGEEGEVNGRIMAKGSIPLDRVIDSNLKTFTSLEQIGVNRTTATIVDIVNALPIDSKLCIDICTPDPDNVQTYPGHGILLCHKTEEERASFKFFGTSGKCYSGMYVAEWLGWKEIFTTEGGTLSGTDIFLNKGIGLLYCGSDEFKMEIRNEIGDKSNRRMLSLSSGDRGVLDSRAVAYTEISSGQNKTYAMYGEHNITKSTTGVTANSTALASGCIHLTYE